jgi:hypothetical protein
LYRQSEGRRRQRRRRDKADRIRHLFPEAATLSGVFTSIERMGAADFLLWRHPTKVARFVCLTELLREESLEDQSGCGDGSGGDSATVQRSATQAL